MAISQYVRIRFARPVKQWPSVLQSVFRQGRFADENGISTFTGSFILRKEGFHWKIDECCGRKHDGVRVRLAGLGDMPGGATDVHFTQLNAEAPSR